MGDLVKIKNTLAESFKESTAKGVMLFCRSITPQFYKNLLTADMAAEKTAIELLTGYIEPEVMRRMCELAVQNYGAARSDNGKVFFDINYIMTFYRAAFNWYWCYNVELSLEADRLGDSYDPTSRIITEQWRDKGNDITVKYIAEDDYNDIVKRHSKNGGWGRYYTPAYWEWDKRSNEERNEKLFESGGF